MTSKVEQLRQAYINVGKDDFSTSEELRLCQSLIKMVWTLCDCPMRPYKDSAELYILHTHGAEQLRRHRSPDWSTSYYDND